MRKQLLVSMLLFLLATVFGLATLSVAAVDPIAKCRSKKLIAVAGHAASALKCHSKAVVKNVALDGTCVLKAQEKLQKKFAKADASGCDTLPDDVEPLSLDAANAVLASVWPSGHETGASKCAADQFKGAGKYAQGLLKADAKQAKKPDLSKLADDEAKALAKLTKSYVKAASRDDCSQAPDLATDQLLIEDLRVDAVGCVEDSINCTQALAAGCCEFASTGCIVATTMDEATCVANTGTWHAGVTECGGEGLCGDPSQEPHFNACCQNADGCFVPDIPSFPTANCSSIPFLPSAVQQAGACIDTICVETTTSTTTTTTTTTTTLAPSCTGDEVGGFCWFLGAEGADCDVTCSNEGLVYDSATETYAGSGGTLANCEAVLLAIYTDFPLSPSDTPVCTDGLGCTFSITNAQVLRCLSPLTTSSAADATAFRACACQ